MLGIDLSWQLMIERKAWQGFVTEDMSRHVTSQKKKGVHSVVFLSLLNFNSSKNYVYAIS